MKEPVVPLSVPAHQNPTTEPESMSSVQEN
jgi:hypothetical protein